MADHDQSEIRQRAYRIWEDAGRPGVLACSPASSIALGQRLILHCGTWSRAATPTRKRPAIRRNAARNKGRRGRLALQRQRNSKAAA
jgi:Protein of unknown function (DUF2934)